MRRKWVELQVHMVWGTWRRRPLITSHIEAKIYSVIRSKCVELHCPPMAIGGTFDHVHLLVRLDPSVSISTLVGAAKGTSAHYATHVLTGQRFFRWQAGYAAFSVGHDDIAATVSYIEQQKVRHASYSVIDTCELPDESDEPLAA